MIDSIIAASQWLGDTGWAVVIGLIVVAGLAIDFIRSQH